MFYLNMFRKSYARAKKNNTNLGKIVYFLACVFFPWIFSKVFARAEVKHTIYFDWPNLVFLVVLSWYPADTREPNYGQSNTVNQEILA